MLGNGLDELAGAVAEVFTTPDVVQVGAVGEANLGEVNSQVALIGCAVDEADSDSSAAERLSPHAEVAALPHAVALFAERVLVNGDGFFAGEQAPVGIAHLAKIVAGEQRRGQQHPKRHVRLVLVERHTAVADLQHVGIVPVSRPSVLGQPTLRKPIIIIRL